MRVAALLITLLATGAWGAEPSAPKVRVQADVQMISLPTPKAIPLIAQLRNLKMAPTALSVIRTMVSRGEAELLAWPHLEASSTGESRSESNTENIARIDSLGVGPPSFLSEAEQKHRLSLAADGRWPFDVPAFFTMVLTGPQLWMRHVRVDGSNVEMQITANLCQPLANHPPLGVSSRWSLTEAMPTYSRYGVSTHLGMVDGETRLLGFFLANLPQPHAVLFLLNIRVPKI